MAEIVMIITNILDLDWYKLTMMYFVWRHYRNVRVKYGFINRTKNVKIARIIDIEHLRDELENIKNLKFQEVDLQYLSGQTGVINKGFFDPEFIKDIANVQLSDFYLGIDESCDQFIIEVEGAWFETILWETFILSTVNELFYRYHYTKEYRELGRAKILQQYGIPRLEDKVKLIKQYPDIKFVEFGTRRRFEKHWQLYINNYLKSEVPNQYLGSSNVFISRVLSQEPMGTLAHEMYSVLAGIHGETDSGLIESFHIFHTQWYETFGDNLSISLTDTFGSDFFFREFGTHAKLWKGLRHDSGDPIDFGNKAIEFYSSLNIDPMTKTLFFSDGLDVHEMIRIASVFCGNFKNIAFGVGTNFTNDIGFVTLSIVMKAIEANGKPLVKLSDNLAKAIGVSSEIERYKRVFGYVNVNEKECKV
jgi:nicotinate phosphoribosyltransferase